MEKKCEPHRVNVRQHDDISTFFKRALTTRQRKRPIRCLAIGSEVSFSRSTQLFLKTMILCYASLLFTIMTIRYSIASVAPTEANIVADTTSKWPRRASRVCFSVPFSRAYACMVISQSAMHYNYSL